MKEFDKPIDYSKRKSKIIAIEGLDAVGKHTQTTLLKLALQKKGLNVSSQTIPYYDEDSAALIKNWLNRSYNYNNPYAIASYYAINRYNTLYNCSWISDAIMNNDVFIFDRYVGSNILYNTSLLDTLSEKAEFCTFIRDYEHGFLQLPEPDIVIYLDLDCEIAHNLNVERSLNDLREIDENESYEFQKQCYDNKELLRLFYPQTVIIDCNYYANKEGKKPSSILSPNTIHEKVLNVVLSRLEV